MVENSFFCFIFVILFIVCSLIIYCMDSEPALYRILREYVLIYPFDVRLLRAAAVFLLPTRNK